MHPPARVRPPRGRVRWLARRPPETLPVPRRARSAPASTPRYTTIPRWGLRQDFTPAPATREGAAESGAALLPFVLRGAALLMLLAAVAEGFAYLLLVVNRSGPVPGVLAVLAEVGVFALGWLAVLATIGVAIVMVLWLQAARARAFRALGTREPRPTWQLWVYCLVPVVNLVAAPVLALELVGAQDRARGVGADRRSLFIRRWWAGWLVLTIVAVGCVAYSRAHGGLQHQADAMAMTAVTYLLSAVFLVATARLVRWIDEGPTARGSEKEKRWLAV